MRSLLVGFALAILAAPVRGSAAEPLHEVAVLKSDSLALYASAVAGFSAECRTEVTEFDLREDPARADRIVKELKSRKPSLIFALGPLAANTAKRAFEDVPIVFAMVPNWEKYGLEAKNVTGVALQRPVRTQLDTLKALAQGTKRVGVIFNPRYSATVVEAASDAAKALGLQLVASKVESPEEVPAVLQALAGKVDALWMIADRAVATPEAVQAIIKLALEKKVPVFALSEQQVKDGALVSLSPNYTAIGQQAGRIANRILEDRATPGTMVVAQPDGLDIAINLTTAKQIGAECNLALEIFKFAAKQGYPIRVFE
ncbi:MAG: ABC transporter substrate-binding protein [Deltaproteobacteria bacterium]|nr:ABC transporter substrate-binding protein [Deltaproteobacteria bacterium]